MSPSAEVNTKHIRQGERFAMWVARDVMSDGQVVIPRGAEGYGEVSYRTGKGAFGKSAKMEFDIVRIAFGGRTIPVSGRYRVEGRGNTGATIGVFVAAGLIGAAFVTGHSAVVPSDSEWRTFTTGRTTFAALPLRTGEQVAFALPRRRVGVVEDFPANAAYTPPPAEILLRTSTPK